MSDGKVNGEPVAEVDEVAEFARAQLTMALREIERRFMGANITVIVSEPGAAAGSPLFNHITTAEDDDLRAVLTSYMLERGWR